MSYQIGKKVVIDEENGSIIVTGNNLSSAPLTLSKVSLVKSDIDTTDTYRINCSESNYFDANVNGPTTWYAHNVPKDCLYILILQLSNGGLGTQTWFPNTKWSVGIPPTLSAETAPYTYTHSAMDLLMFLTDDGGTTWYGLKLDDDVINFI